MGRGDDVIWHFARIGQVGVIELLGFGRAILIWLSLWEVNVLALFHGYCLVERDDSGKEQKGWFFSSS